MFQPEQLPNYLLVGGFILSVMTNIGMAVKFVLERKTTVEVNAYHQLSQLFESLQKQVEKKEQKDEKLEGEYDRLEADFDILLQKVKAARLDLMDVKKGLADIKRFIKTNKLDDIQILQTIEEIESKLKEIGEQLK